MFSLNTKKIRGKLTKIASELHSEIALIVTLTAESILPPPESIYAFILPRYKTDMNWKQADLPAIKLILMLAYLSGRIRAYSDYIRKIQSVYGIVIKSRQVGNGNLPFVFELRFDPKQTYIIKGWKETITIIRRRTAKAQSKFKLNLHDFQLVKCFGKKDLSMMEYKGDRSHSTIEEVIFRFQSICTVICSLCKLVIAVVSLCFFVGGGFNW